MEPTRLSPVHVDGCLPAPQRRTLDKLAERDNQLVHGLNELRGRPGPDYLHDILWSEYPKIENHTGGPWTIAVINTMFREGVLAQDLTRDGTATLNLYDQTTDAVYDPNQTITVDGFYVLSGMKVPSGTRIKASWNGVCWRAEVADRCQVSV
jgi:hypothetical protein